MGQLSTKLVLTAKGDCDFFLAEPHVLCQRCRKLGDDIAALDLSIRMSASGQYFEHCPNISSLQSSALKGCHLCILVWDNLPRNEQQNFWESVATYFLPIILRLYDQKESEGEPDLCLGIEFRGLMGKVGGVLGITDQEKLKLSEVLEFRDAQLSFSTGSSGCIRLAKSWLATCQKDHTHCCLPSTQPGELPTRLLDVEKRVDSDLRLYIVNQESDAGSKYLTLSHCWGKLDILTLKTANLTRLIDGFRESEMPKTFKDTIQLTRILGFKYLWIDALCIIQDDVMDWKREASRMATVYENSTCKESSGTFLLPNFRTNSNALLVTPKNVYGEFMGDSGHILSNSAPLHTRAWVVQERFMSPRTLNFGSRRIQWECREHGAYLGDTETEFRSIGNPAPVKAAFKVLRTPSHPIINADDRQLFYRAWGTFLAQYTLGRLTQPEDRLVALLGIVNVVRQSTGLSIASGLWKELLPFEILWCRVLHHFEGYSKETPPFQRASTQRLPTWSWASQDGPVYSSQIGEIKAPTLFIDSFEFTSSSQQLYNNGTNESQNCALCISGPLMRRDNCVIGILGLNLFLSYQNVPVDQFIIRSMVAFDSDELGLKDLAANNFGNLPRDLFFLLVARGPPLPRNELTAMWLYHQSVIHEKEFFTMMIKLSQLKQMVNKDERNDNEIRSQSEQICSADVGHAFTNEADIEIYKRMNKDVKYDQNVVVDHGLVLEAVENGQYRRRGVFRSYHSLEWPPLFEKVPPVSRITII